MEEDLFIPQKISVYGMITAHIFLVLSYMYFYRCNKISAYLTFLLYMSTVLYWYKLNENSFRKYFDIFIAVSSLIYFTFIEIKNLNNKYKILWYATSLIIIVVYITNSIIYKKQIVYKSNNIMDNNYSYFCLKYTKQNTQVREKACKTNVFVHLIFLHLLPGLISILCLLNTKNS
jgi:hypothetical protein